MESRSGVTIGRGRDSPWGKTGWFEPETEVHFSTRCARSGLFFRKISATKPGEPDRSWDRRLAGLLDPRGGRFLQFGDPGKNPIEPIHDFGPCESIERNSVPGKVPINLGVKSSGLDRFVDAGEVRMEERGRAFIPEKARKQFPGWSIQESTLLEAINFLLAAATLAAALYLNELNVVPFGELSKASVDRLGGELPSSRLRYSDMLLPTEPTLRAYIVALSQLPRFGRAVLAFLRDWDDYRTNRPRR